MVKDNFKTYFKIEPHSIIPYLILKLFKKISMICKLHCFHKNIFVLCFKFRCCRYHPMYWF